MGCALWIQEDGPGISNPRDVQREMSMRLRGLGNFKFCNHISIGMRDIKR